MGRKIRYEGKYLRYVIDGTWEFTERVGNSDVVMIAAVTPENEFLLVEQYRPAVQANVIELTAGLVGDINERETIEEAAFKELEEETGYRADHMELIARGPVSPGLADEIANFYWASGLKKTGSGGGDDTENITVHKISLNNVESWLAERAAEGRYIDPKVYAGVFFALKKLSI